MPAPRSWKIERKTAFWAIKPRPGPHGIDESVPVGSVLRDMLHYCDTAREARAILSSRAVRVDGRPVTDPKFAIGVMDVLALDAMKEQHRMLVDTLGRLHLVPIDAEQAKWKLCRIENKTTVTGGKIQLNLHDGRNILLAKSQYAAGDSLRLAVPEQKVLEHFPLETGVLALLVGGKHVGELAHVERVERTRNPRANVVHFREGFSTNADKVFVVGKDAPAIPIPQVVAAEVTP